VIFKNIPKKTTFNYCILHLKPHTFVRTTKIETIKIDHQKRNIMQTLCIVSQLPIFLMGLDHLFTTSSTIQVAFTASNEAQFWQAMTHQSPDIIILDSHFADLCAKIKLKHGVCSKILLLGTPADAKKLKLLFTSGASGFTLQTVEPAALLDAVERTLKGELYVHPDLISAYLNPKPAVPAAIEVLTKREQEVLNLIVNEKTTQEIASYLYISLATVETHRHHLIHKLGVKNTAGLVREAMRATL
jgi:DNA-binding NarL/FixJ family response regulator